MAVPEPLVPVPPSQDEARVQLDLTARLALDQRADARILGTTAVAGGALLGCFAAAMVWVGHHWTLLLVVGAAFLVLLVPIAWWERRLQGTPRHASRLLLVGRLLMVPGLLWGAPLLERLGLERGWALALGAFVLAGAPMVVTGLVVLRRGRRAQ
jgi:hypothetical protein